MVTAAALFSPLSIEWQNCLEKLPKFNAASVRRSPYAASPDRQAKQPDAVAGLREAMNQTASPFIDGLVDEEIRRLVAEAVANSNTISTSECVARIKHVYPTCGLSDREISDRVISAASAAGIAVEFGAANELPD